MADGIKKIFQTPLTDISTTDKEGVGTIRFEGNNIYKWILFNNGAGSVASVANYCAYYYGVSGVGTSGYTDSEVTMDRTDAVNGAGVFQAVIADGSYGWIQIKGVATLGVNLTAGADGNALTDRGAGADGTLDVSGLVTDQVCAYAFDKTADIIICDFPF